MLSRIQQALSFFVHNLKPTEGFFVRYSAARPKRLQVSTSLPLCLACSSGLQEDPILKEPQ